jgi:NTP pyrophosphatase (non-canonical NTP hydrolase)
MHIREMQQKAGEDSKRKGFHDAPATVGDLLMLVCTEAAEAMEDYRTHEAPDGAKEAGFELTDIIFASDDGGVYSEQKTDADIEEMLAEERAEPDGLTPEREKDIRKLYKPCGFPSELADIIIRVGDLAYRYGIDLEKAIEEKMKYNATRTFMHGGKKV